jgi:hypothetical protein
MRKNRKIKGKRLILLINKCMNKFTVTYISRFAVCKEGEGLRREMTRNQGS